MESKQDSNTIRLLADLTPEQRRIFVDTFLRPRRLQTYVNAQESGTRTPPITWEGWTGRLRWNELKPEQQEKIIQSRMDKLTIQKAEEKEAEDLRAYERKLDQMANRGEITRETARKRLAARKKKKKDKEKPTYSGPSKKGPPKPPPPRGGGAMGNLLLSGNVPIRTIR